MHVLAATHSSIKEGIRVRIVSMWLVLYGAGVFWCDVVWFGVVCYIMLRRGLVGLVTWA